MHYIYKIQNKINDKIYVGQSNNPTHRWSKHIYWSNKVDDPKFKNHKNVKYIQVVHYAMAKYGIENFEFKILEEVDTLEEANNREGYWEQHYCSLVPNGYNVEPGGNARPMTEETKRKISEAKKGRYTGKDNHLYGKKRSQEVKEKIRKAKMGQKHSKESLSKMSKTWFKQGERVSPDTEFKKGEAPWNKGTKGLMKPPTNGFTKGQRPHNKLPDDIREKIKNDTRPSKVVAKEYEIGKTTVLRIRKESSTNRKLFQVDTQYEIK